MGQQADLNELMEGLLMLARNPIALELQRISTEKADLTELLKRYDGFKDGEFLALLSVIFGMNFEGSVPEVVEKGIGMSYPIGKPTKRKGGYADEERIPQGTGIDHVRAGTIAGRACRPTA